MKPPWKSPDDDLKCWWPPDQHIAAGQAHLGKMHDDLVEAQLGLHHQLLKRVFWKMFDFRWVPTCWPQQLSRWTCTPHPLPPQPRFIFRQIYWELFHKCFENISPVWSLKIFSWKLSQALNFSRTLWLETMRWSPTTSTFGTCPPRSRGTWPPRSACPPRSQGTCSSVRGMLEEHV